MPSHTSTVIILLAAILSVTNGCAVKQGVGSGAPSAEYRLVTDSLPSDSEGLATADLTPDLVSGWAALKSAHFARAGEIFTGALEGPPLEGPGRAAAFSGLGFARLGLSNLHEAGEAFADALEAEPRYGPALLGQAVRLRLQGRADESVAYYEALWERFPQSTAIKLGAEAARLEAVQLLVRRGEEAEQDGDPETASGHYRRAIGFDPDLPQLYGLLAASLESCGRYPEALQALDESLVLAEGDEARAFRERLAWLELEHGSPERAVILFQALLQTASEDPAILQEGLRQAEEKQRDASMPAEYRQLLAGRIPLDRGGLAAIIALEFNWDEGDAPGGGARPRVIRDAAAHWSQPYIRAVVDRGVMDLYQNHTFRPAAQVSRGDLAFAACRLLDHVGGEGVQATATVAFTDLSSDHRHFRCIGRLVSLGLVKRFPDGTVRINTTASGVDALEMISAMHRRCAEPEP